ncbi:MAG: adenosine kinase [Okeania sp. SIO3I5]|uniref:adenosine kinase n=1 Tax=Okeania sp. SIO3I5 TaxID=2607805 RepID=UPI0013BC58FA|nr:adenosine kinase [Okeania sp. SIO3I5]NEQ40688.1 adenosine kinase [Okeania sp. SIO3I5]
MTAVNTQKLDVYGVGNALVDILALVEEDFITKYSLQKSGMTLMDAQTQGGILAGLENISLKKRSGGSAANSMIAIAQSGGTGIFVAKVASDPNGELYRQDMLDFKIEFNVAPVLTANEPTGTCVVLTTPDAERTMCTNLGASVNLSASDIDAEQIKRCQYTYVEGYLWTGDDTKQACIQAMEHSKRQEVKVCFTFSDLFLVDLFADDFRQVLSNYCDVLFCNADEARNFSGIDSLEKSAMKIGELVETAFITDGKEGCLVVKDKQITPVPGFPATAIDTVGAGDAFAGGVLYGLTHGYQPTQAARWGNYLASNVVQIQGPRLEGSWADKVEQIIN